MSLIKSKIPYLDGAVNWNLANGCKKISPACKHCWAETMNKRFHPDEKFSDVELFWDKLTEPLGWRRPQLVATCFTTDLFQGDVPDEFIKRAINTVLCSRSHTYVMLTKRAERAHSLLKTIKEDKVYYERLDMPVPRYINAFLKNVWLGVTIEGGDFVKRAEHLRTISMDGYKWLSLEPLLGPIDPEVCEGMNWVVVGGESGNPSRYMNPKWVRPLRDYCLEQDIPFYFKQWGTQKKGYILDNITYRDVPFAPRVSVKTKKPSIQRTLF